MEQIKVNLESRIEDLVTINIDLQKKIENLEKKQTNITPPILSSLLSKTKPAEFESKVLNAILAEVKEKSSKEKNIVIFGLKESTKNTKEEK
jgi:tRNA C32,U32 (ribose-2'-O)-methylase TrmJ